MYPPGMLHDDATPILNPRRAPRLPVRCLVRAEAGGAPFESTTEDLGPLGCQLVSPAALEPGTSLKLKLAHLSLPEPLLAGGQVTWTTPVAPWRHGVAFAVAHHEAVARWLLRLSDLHPELCAASRAPARLAADARLYLGEPPRHLLDFTAAELAVLRHVREGVTAGELRRRLSAAWEPAVAALFSLLARRVVALTPPHDPAAEEAAWTAPLGPPRPVAVARLKLRPAPRGRGD